MRSLAMAPSEPMDDAEDIRRTFALGWGRIGAAWGVAPSTATVQGYLLVHGGPLTEAQIRHAVGLSHRATLIALDDCESWGLIEQAERRRSGRRGPTARAWVPVGDHWEWFRRVAAVRKERETDPVLPLLDECRRRAERSGADDLHARLSELVVFVHLFDRALGTIVGTDAADLQRLFAVLGRLDPAALSRLVEKLGGLPQDDLVAAVETLAALPAARLHRLVSLAGQPAVARALGARSGRAARRQG
jgi:DNA-binding transcriptional regulator GbsR (MarR family)